MRTLYLLRHAKSNRDDPGLPDRDRPLARRGIESMPYLADHMRAAGIAPDVLLCSSARRTRETLELLGDAVPSRCEVRVEDWLYGATAAELLEGLRGLADDVHRAMLIGHNPAVQRLAMRLAASGGALARLERKFPTAALATLDAPIEGWADLDTGCAQLMAFVSPDDLGAPR